MPDISMCRNKECPSYSRCYRAQAVPNPRRQSIMKFDHKGGSRCEYFWQIESDLVFEGMEFSMEPQWPMAIRKSRVIIPEFDENGVAKVESLKEKMANPDMVTNPEELGQQHRELCPLLGTVTFSIGS